ncbi:hypothetical protein TNCV_4367761 [Trichonephila clavipes]|nr:hypothetical protein TNCV_4367761 [Trichonephila clavipes]
MNSAKEQRLIKEPHLNELKFVKKKILYIYVEPSMPLFPPISSASSGGDVRQSVVAQRSREVCSDARNVRRRCIDETLHLRRGNYKDGITMLRGD